MYYTAPHLSTAHTYIGEVESAAFCFFFGRALQQFIDGRIDALIPLAEIFQSVCVVQISHMIDVYEAVDGAQFYQALFADHFDLKRETEFYQRLRSMIYQLVITAQMASV